VDVRHDVRPRGAGVGGRGDVHGVGTLRHGLTVFHRPDDGRQSERGASPRGKGAESAPEAIETTRSCGKRLQRVPLMNSRGPRKPPTLASASWSLGSSRPRVVAFKAG
jgi:hypothetical protein